MESLTVHVACRNELQSRNVYQFSCPGDHELVHMYLSSGRLAEAQLAFQRLSSCSSDPGIWTTMIAALSEHGWFDDAFRSFQFMQLAGVAIDKVAFLTVLNACTAAEAAVWGTAVHGYSVESGLSTDVAVGTAIVNMYGKCGCLVEAHQVFLKMAERNVVTWSVMVAAFARDGHFLESLFYLRKMQLEGTPPNRFTLVNALRSCSCHQALAHGRILHGWISEAGLDSNLVVANALVSMYSRCGDTGDALRVFESIGTRDVIMWTSMIGGYSQAGNCEAALRLFQRMQLDGAKPDKITFVTLLNSKPTSPTTAKLLDELITEAGCVSDTILGTALVEMHSKCGSLPATYTAFERISHKGVVPWSALISANVDHGESEQGLYFFRRMQVEGVRADKVALVKALAACSTSRFIPHGKLIHSFIAERGFEADNVVSNALIEMYGRCRDLAGAAKAFQRMMNLHEDVVSWNSIIAAHGECGREEEALKLFSRMQLHGRRPDRVTFISVLNALSAAGSDAADETGAVLRLVSETGHSADPEVESATLRTYTSCGFHKQANEHFHRMQRKTVVCWNLMIGSSPDSTEALQKFHLMQLDGYKPDGMTLAAALNACARGELLADGKSIHACFRFEDELISSCLIRLYGKCGRLDTAAEVFHELPCRTSIGWNGLATVYADNMNAEKALRLIQKMQLEGFQPDKVTLSSSLNACESPEDLKLGVKITEQVVLRGWERDTVLGTAIMNMHGSCGGSLVKVGELFKQLDEPDVVSLNAVISAHVRHGEFTEAVGIFRRMQLEGVKATKVTMVTVLNGCTDGKAGKMVHACIKEAGYELDDVLVGNALVTMYGRCGEPESGEKLFRGMRVRDTASWNTLMTGLNERLQSDRVMCLFHRMQLEGARADVVTFVCMLSAAVNLTGAAAVWSKVELLEALVVEAGVESSETVQNGFMNVYAKAGKLSKAGEIFQRVAQRGDVISWNSMIAAYSQAGDVNEAMQVFLEMQQEGVEPDGVTFISILSSCSHSGQVAVGLAVFTSMSTDYGVAVTLEHYGCMVDLYGRSGRLKEAEKVLGLEGSVCKEFEALHWMIMLSACKTQNETELGEMAAKKLMEIHPEKSSILVQLSNLYAYNNGGLC